MGVRTGKQIAESIPVMILLAVSGGLQDSYTYLLRGSVFANAQTGNIVLLSVKLFEGNFSEALKYLWPVIAFALGVLVTEQTAHIIKKKDNSGNWRLAILITEALILMSTAFMPQSMNPVANSLISFSCAMQVQAFREVNGHEYASTMCIGNLRAGTVSLSKWIRHRDREDITKALYYLAVIVLFGIGAGLGSLLMGVAGLYAILASCILLMAAFTVILIGQERR
ncbi:MAG: DUF1275 domain-containing protein [Clostridiales bacterium]|nr:DUF1275 domain-containing protein [Clostridiales bacterium]